MTSMTAMARAVIRRARQRASWLSGIVTRAVLDTMVREQQRVHECGDCRVELIACRCGGGG